MLWCSTTTPQKDKLLVCVEPLKGAYMMINSIPRRFVADAQVLIKQVNHPFLEHDSYVDASRIWRFTLEYVLESLEREAWRRKGRANVATRHAIIEAAQQCCNLTRQQKELVLTGLSSPRTVSTTMESGQ